MPSLINYIGRINFSEFHLLKRTEMGISLKWFMILSSWQMFVNNYTWTRNIAKFLFLPDKILNLCVHFTESNGFDLLEIFPFYRELNIKISVYSALPQTTSLGFLSSELSISLFTIRYSCGWKIHEVLSLLQQITKFGCCLFVSVRLQEQLSCRTFLFVHTRTSQAIMSHMYPYRLLLRCWDRDWALIYCQKRTYNNLIWLR